MKPLETIFVANNDKSGDNTFTQVRQDGLVHIYKRSCEGKATVTYEVFRAKEIKAGSPLPGGGFEAIDRIQYPGTKAFGRSAWSTPSLERANWIADKLIKGEHPFHSSIAQNIKESSSSSSVAATKPVATPAKGKKAIKGKVHEVERNGRIWKGVLPNIPLTIPGKEFTSGDFRAANEPAGHPAWRLTNELHYLVSVGEVIATGKKTFKKA